MKLCLTIITVVSHVRSHKRYKMRSFKMGMDLLEISKIFRFFIQNHRKIYDPHSVPSIHFNLCCVLVGYTLCSFLDVEQSGDHSFSSYIKDKNVYFRAKVRIIPILLKMPHQMLVFASFFSKTFLFLYFSLTIISENILRCLQKYNFQGKIHI